MPIFISSGFTHELFSWSDLYQDPASAFFLCRVSKKIAHITLSARYLTSAKLSGSKRKQFGQRFAHVHIFLPYFGGRRLSVIFLLASRTVIELSSRRRTNPRHRFLFFFLLPLFRTAHFRRVSSWQSTTSTRTWYTSESSTFELHNSCCGAN